VGNVSFEWSRSCIRQHLCLISAKLSSAVRCNITLTAYSLADVWTTHTMIFDPAISPMDPPSVRQHPLCRTIPRSRTSKRDISYSGLLVCPTTALWYLHSAVHSVIFVTPVSTVVAISPPVWSKNMAAQYSLCI